MAVLDLTAASFLSPPQVHSRRRTTLSTERACGALACADAGLDEQQLKYMEEERIILVDIHDRVLGAQSKVSSHLCEYGPLLHRAFSVFLFDSQGRMLLQKRAAEKITFPNHWTNTCCSHPLYTPHEMGTDLTPADPLLGVKRAAIRKLGHELGIPASELPLESMTYMGRIHYIADSDDRWGEHEIDYVFFIQADVTLEANANEVCETAYMSAEEVGELFGTAESKGVKVTPWARHIVEQFVFDWWKSLGDQQKLEEQAEFEVIHRMGVCAHPEWSDPSQLYHPETTPMREVGDQPLLSACWASPGMRPGTVSVTREIADLEAEVAKYEASNLALGEKLLSIQRQKRTVEEELVSENIRLKVVLDEHRERQQQDALPQNVSDRSVSQAELQTRIERALISVFEQKLHDRNWALEDGTTSTAAAHGWGGNQVRVEFEGAEVFWALLDYYTFEMLLQDAARFFDLPPVDCALHDERGAIWPFDAYVNVELRGNPDARIELRIKPLATAVEEDPAIYGIEGDDDSDSEAETELDFLRIAEQAEDGLLIALARGKTAQLTTKQKLALRRKLGREWRVFLLFIIVFAVVLRQRRSVQDAYYVQQAIATAFVEEEFGDFNEKTFNDIATPEELFDWMTGPLLEGLYPDEYYNGMPIPADRLGYVMEYNKLVGRIRLRQLRVKEGEGCSLAPALFQEGTTRAGEVRRRQFVGHCYSDYTEKVRDESPFGLDPTLGEPSNKTTGFRFYTAEENNLLNTPITGQYGVYDGSGYVVDLSSTNRSGWN